MRFRAFLETRDKGRSLPETGYEYRNCTIYRAVALHEANFKAMDYVGVDNYGKRFAIKHAAHQAAVEGEPFHVIKAMVPAAHVFEAYNPGEYFYDGPEVVGRPVPGTRVDPD